MRLSNHNLDPMSLSVIQVDAALRALATLRNGQDHQLGVLLLRADELQIERVHGYGSIREYCERVLGFGPRCTEDRLRVARALRDLPRLNELSERGEILFAVLREVCRIATADTEAAWLEAIDGKTSREVQRMVAGRLPGERPSDPQDPELLPRRLSFEVSPEVYALVMDAREHVTRKKGTHVDDSKFLAELALAYHAGGERDAGRAAYQIAITVGPDGAARMKAGSDSVAIRDSTLAQARCDAEELGIIDGVGAAPRVTRSVPPKTRRQVMRRHGGRCAVPGCGSSSFVEVHHIVPRSEGGRHDPEQLVVLCSAHHEATHAGTIEIRGVFSTGFTFSHADGRAYGSAEVSARRSLIMSQAFEALRSMGWKDKEVRSMLDAVRTRVQSDVALTEVVKLALQTAPMPGFSNVVREAVVPYVRSG